MGGGKKEMRCYFRFIGLGALAGVLFGTFLVEPLIDFGFTFVGGTPLQWLAIVAVRAMQIPCEAFDKPFYFSWFLYALNGCFWGSVVSLIYAVHIDKLPVILGYVFLPVLYARNLVLLGRDRNGGGEPGPA